MIIIIFLVHPDQRRVSQSSRIHIGKTPHQLIADKAGKVISLRCPLCLFQAFQLPIGTAIIPNISFFSCSFQNIKNLANGNRLVIPVQEIQIDSICSKAFKAFFYVSDNCLPAYPRYFHRIQLWVRPFCRYHIVVSLTTLLQPFSNHSLTSCPISR